MGLPSLYHVPKWVYHFYTMFPSGSTICIPRSQVGLPSLYHVPKWVYHLYTMFSSGSTICIPRSQVCLPSLYHVLKWVYHLYTTFPSGCTIFIPYSQVGLPSLYHVPKWVYHLYTMFPTGGYNLEFIPWQGRSLTLLRQYSENTHIRIWFASFISVLTDRHLLRFQDTSYNLQTEYTSFFYKFTKIKIVYTTQVCCGMRNIYLKVARETLNIYKYS